MGPATMVQALRELSACVCVRVCVHTRGAVRIKNRKLHLIDEETQVKYISQVYRTSKWWSRARSTCARLRRLHPRAIITFSLHFNVFINFSLNTQQNKREIRNLVERIASKSLAMIESF